MKKVEEVEVEYVKKTTTLVLSVFCLVIGFVIGIVYSGMNTPTVRKSRVSQPQPAAQPQAPAAQPVPQVDKSADIVQFKQILGANPKDAAAWAKLGHAYFDSNRYDEAIDAYRKHLELNPKNANVWTDMGVMYRRSKRPMEAIRCFDKAAEANPKHQTAPFNKGIVLMYDLKKKAEALAVWQGILDKDPAAKAPDGRPLGQLIKENKEK